MTNRLFTFVGGVTGTWEIVKMDTVVGMPLEKAERLDVIQATSDTLPNETKWLLRGVTSNVRYVTRQERDLLMAKEPGLGRAEATCAALIPVRKSEFWWELTQDDRRAIFETRSEHIKTGLKYLPAVARRLHHCRDLGEPFDFLTWFEYAPSDSEAFEQLVDILRGTEEWTYVEREIDIRLVRAKT